MTDGPDMLRFLMDRLADQPRDLEIVGIIADAMGKEQGFPPVVPDESPVTDLGTQVLKLIAATYSNHRDYRQAWAPDSNG